ncbi:MAG: hypothetical protein GKR94_10335 [Gammaproteobacteria bacterium]|nr:hypothetical protein [Gammaproteobacteria bacterium]
MSLILAAVILAFLSWKFIEKPFRSRTLIARKSMFIFVFAAFSATTLLGLVGHHYDKEITYLRYAGNPARAKTYIALEKARETSPVFIRTNRFSDGECKFSVENLSDEIAYKLSSCRKKYSSGILVIGDSHATNLYHSLVRNTENSKDYHFLVGITKNGCHLPTEDLNCQYKEVLRFVTENNDVFSRIIYEKAGHLMLLNSSKRDRMRDSSFRSDLFRVDEKIVDGVVSYLKNLSEQVPVVWFGPRLEPLIGDGELFHETCESDFILSDNHKMVFTALDEYLEPRVSALDEITYISQMQSYQFEFPRDYGSCNGLLWMDKSHFSTLGERFFGQRYNLLRNDVFIQPK